MTEIAQVKVSLGNWEGFTLSRFLVRRRVTLMLLTVIGLVGLMLVRKYRPANDILSIGDPWVIAGTLCIGCGLFVRSWAAAILQKGSVLATQGPYSACRHPLYLGSLLMVLGFCALIGDLWTAGILLTVLLVTYPATIAYEETLISATFPSLWPSYVAHTTSRILPQRLPRSWGPATWAQWRHNREYRAIMAVGIGLVALVAWRQLMS